MHTHTHTHTHKHTCTHAHTHIHTQILHSYLEDDGVTVDNDTAVKLGCLELRRFYKDMPQVALKKKENFAMLE